MVSVGGISGKVKREPAEIGTDRAVKAARDTALRLAGVYPVGEARAIVLEWAQRSEPVGPWVREPDGAGGEPFNREDARAFIREEMERTQQEQRAAKLATATKRRPHKPVTYELACRRWRGYEAQYKPLFGKSRKPPLRDFPVWWGNHHPADAVSASTLDKLRKTWNPATEPFPPDGDDG